LRNVILDCANKQKKLKLGTLDLTGCYGSWMKKQRAVTGWKESFQREAEKKRVVVYLALIINEKGKQARISSFLLV